jgi:hypothetical protein
MHWTVRLLRITITEVDAIEVEFLLWPIIATCNCPVYSKMGDFLTTKPRVSKAVM